MSDLLRLDRPNTYIARLQLNRLDARNALNRSLIRECERRLEELQNEDEVRVLIISGVGAAFSAGADLREIRAMTPAEGREFSLAGHRLFEAIEQFPAPVIAAVNGYALGGGCELACACDLRYASASARFGQPESKVGMIPGWGGTFRLPRYIGIARTKEMIFTGEMLDAEEALDIGLVNRVFPEESFANQVLERARTIVTTAPIANRTAKQLLNRYPNDRQAMIHQESLAFSFCMATEDQTEAVDAFLEKRSPEFKNR